MGTKTQLKYASAAADSTRTVRLAEILRARWKNEIKKLPPAARWAWLKSSEGIAALGAGVAANLVRQLERRARETLRSVCSPTFAEDWLSSGVLPPELAFEGDDLIVQVRLRPEQAAAELARVRIDLGQKLARPDVSPAAARSLVVGAKARMAAIEHAGRRFSVRLKRSRGLVRVGLHREVISDLPTAEAGTSRWTPPQVVEWEDETDTMPFPRAYYFRFPPSVSGLQFQLIEMRKGREVDHRPRLKVKKRKGKVVDVVETDYIRSSDRTINLTQAGGVYRQGEPTSDTVTMPGDRHVRAVPRDLPRIGSEGP